MAPNDILEDAFRVASGQTAMPLLPPSTLANELAHLATARVKAPLRVALACLVAKIHRPDVDARKPFKGLGGEDSFSGRKYDEAYLTPFANRHKLRINKTTGFLTSAFRTKNGVLALGTNMQGSNPRLYEDCLTVLDAVQSGAVSPMIVLCELMRLLIAKRDEAANELEVKLDSLSRLKLEAGLPLPSEGIASLIAGQFTVARASRLPVLLLAAVYDAVGASVGERTTALHAHNAADSQTGAGGDIEVSLISDNSLVTIYEMKMKRVTEEDLDIALQKAAHRPTLQNYILITTEHIDPALQAKAAGLYVRHGVEFAVLNCLGFVRHFLHLFHRQRIDFLDAYQALILAEPESALSQEQKAFWLSARIAAESLLNDMGEEEEAG